MVNKRREESAFHRQWQFPQGKSSHEDEYGHGQEKRKPSTYVEEEENRTEDPTWLSFLLDYRFLMYPLVVAGFQR